MTAAAYPVPGCADCTRHWTRAGACCCADAGPGGLCETHADARRILRDMDAPPGATIDDDPDAMAAELCAELAKRGRIAYD